MSGAICESKPFCSEDPATMEMISLMNMTSEVSFMSGLVDDDRDASFHGDGFKIEGAPIESPRGLGAWADIFADEETTSNLPPLLPDQQEWQLPLPSTTNSTFDASPIAQYEILEPTQNSIQKKGGGGLRAKREKARAETLLRMLGVDMDPVALPNVCVAPPPKVADAASRPPVRSRDRKIRNRASVQRCRAKKLERYETMEKERRVLRKENEVLAAALDALSEIVQTGVANLRNVKVPKEL